MHRSTILGTRSCKSNGMIARNNGMLGVTSLFISSWCMRPAFLVPVAPPSSAIVSKSLNVKLGPRCAAYSKSRFACFAIRFAAGTDINPRSTCNVRNVARILGRFSSCSRRRATRCIMQPFRGILQVILGTLRLNRKLLPSHRLHECSYYMCGSYVHVRGTTCMPKRITYTWKLPTRRHVVSMKLH